MSSPIPAIGPWNGLAPPDLDPDDLTIGQMRVCACPVCFVVAGEPCRYVYATAQKGNAMPTHHLGRIRCARRWLNLDALPGDVHHDALAR